MATIEIEIDGVKLEAQPEQMVIQVADAAGIYIPRFCYHKHLSIAANCRMCLVDVEKSPKTLPACATPVIPGMKVFTKSAKALAAQRAVMEFLLINHPLDCPICDQGGECELQDLSLGYGRAESYYTAGKRSVKDQDIGPLVATDMTRCIQCTRCVRFGTEVAGLRELGAIGRGEELEISTFVEKSMQSELAGNIIDLCPVGALTSKPFRFKARAWELNQYASVAAHDCVGSNLYLHARNGAVMRAVPRENPKINKTWISDRDRFSYQGFSSADRLVKPLIKRNGEWQEVDWQTALLFAVTNIGKVLEAKGVDQFAALASPTATLEEYYLLQRLMRGLGSPHVDHRLRETDFSDQDSFGLFPGLGMSLNALEQSDAILLVGSNIQHDQPMAGHRVRQAFLNNARIMAVNAVDYPANFTFAAKKITAPHNFVLALAGVAKALVEKTHATVPPSLQDLLKTVVVDTAQENMAEHLAQGKNAVILLGALALHHPQAAALRACAELIAKLSHAHVGYLTDGANTAGAWLAGAVPHRTAAGHKAGAAGLNAQAMFTQARNAYLLLNVEPDLDVIHSAVVTAALQQADFVVSLSVFKNPSLLEHADVILPIVPITETSGTLVNAVGDWQSVAPAVLPFGEARPAWKVLRVLGNLMHLKDFDYDSTETIRDEVRQLVEGAALENLAVARNLPPQLQVGTAQTITRIGEVPIYSVDGVVRRAEALQKQQTIMFGDLASVRINPKLAAQLQVQQGDQVLVKQGAAKTQLAVMIDANIAENSAWIATGIPATVSLGALFDEIEIRKV